jgi:hypothetical protein
MHVTIQNGTLVYCVLATWIGISTAYGQQHLQEPTQKSNRRSAKPDFMRPLIQPDVAKQYRNDWLDGQYGIPKADQIVNMKAEVYQAPQYGPDIERFDVPKENYEKIISLFDNSVIETDPNPILTESGSLLIKTRDQRIRRISWFSGADGPLTFSIQGVRCIVDAPPTNDGAGVFDNCIRRVFEKSRARNK